jgi:hypothetical protein
MSNFRDYRDFIRTRSRPWVRIETTEKKPGHIVITSRGAVTIGSDK